MIPMNNFESFKEMAVLGRQEVLECTVELMEELVEEGGMCGMSGILMPMLLIL